jgi:mitogen-activated protein kinase organizer 1
MSTAAAPPALPLARVRELRGHTAPVQTVTFNADGRYAITGSADRTLCLWNPYRPAPDGGGSSGAGDTGGLLIKQYRGGHGYDVTGVAVAPDNGRFVSVGGDKCAFLWDTGTGTVIRRIYGHEQRVNAVALNADGNVAFTASDDKAVRAWDLRASSRAPVQAFTDFRDNATGVVVAPSGDVVLACSHDGTLRSYDLRAAASTCDALGVPLNSLALSRDGNCVLLSTLAGGGRLLLLERGGGSLLAQYAGGHTNALYRLTPCFTPDDAHVVAPSEDGSVAFYDLVEGRLAGRIPARGSGSGVGHKRVVSCVAPHPSPTGPGGGVVLTASYDGTAALWCVPGREAELASLVLAGGSAAELGLLGAAASVDDDDYDGGGGVSHDGRRGGRGGGGSGGAGGAPFRRPAR